MVVHPQARGEVPKVPNGVSEKSSSGRPERPRARDRPKPRRRPRPKEAPPGETTRRSRSAPAQTSPTVPEVSGPPTHTAHHEGFLFRKLDIETLKKSANRWVFRVMAID